MSKTTTYIVSNNTELENRNSEYKYIPGSSTFEIPFSDIDDDILKIENPSAANGAVVTQVSSNNNTRKIIVTPGASVKTSGKSYSTVIKYNITYNQTDDKGNSITKVAYSKVIFSVTFQDNVGQCIMTAHNGKLRPDEYIGVHPENNDLESLVTKKSLISNLKEFGNQVSSKIGSASALSINYNLNGGHWDEGFEPRYTFVNSTGYTAKAPKRLGYVFAGWNVYPASGTEGTEPAEADRLYSANATGAVIEVGTTQNITAYAQWTPIKYKVVFNNKDGEVIANPIFTYGSNTTASSIAKPDAAAGYEFTNSYKIIGLNDQEVIYDVTKKLDRVYDLVKTDHETGTPTFTLTPIFAPKIYTINYEIDGGVLETNNTSDTYTYGTSFVLPTPIRSGYSFNGWTAVNPSSNFVQQRVISPSDLINISTSTLNLKAVWTKNNYHFEFDTQGGILNGNTTIYIQPDTTYNISNPSKEGYNFAGWEVDATKATCNKGDNTTYNVTTKDDINTDIILKAKWIPVQVNVNVEYWYESISTNRSPDTLADLSNTIYTLNTIRPLTLDSNQKAVTDSNLTVSVNTNNDIIITGKTGTSNGNQTITPEEGFSYVGYSISDNGKVNANGTSVIKLYFSRKTAYYKIIDKYSDATNSGIEEGSRTIHYRKDNNAYSCLYGQSITVHPIFTESNPERGYTVSNSAITKTVNTLDTNSPTIFTFEYSKKIFTVKFDLNNVGTYSNSTIKGNIYSTTCKYGNIVVLPTITAFSYISTSSWYLNGNKVNDTADSITIVEDSNVIRAFEFKQYNLVREKDDGNWSYNGTKVTDNVTERVTYNNFPYYLKPATKDGYVFSHWLYRTNINNSYIPLGGNTLSGSILESDITSISYKPEFVAEEPKITSIEFTKGTNNSLELTIKTNSVTSHIYFKAISKNGAPIEGLGREFPKASQNTYSLVDGTGNGQVPNITENSEILITPVYKNTSNVITNTGKPWYGIIQKVGTGSNQNNLTVTAYPVYGVIGNDTDTTYGNATDSKDGLMSATDKAKLDGIKNNANKTTASVTDISKNFASTPNSPTTFDSPDTAVVYTKAYNIGSITPDETNSASRVDFKFIDTTYGKATNQKYGLVKLGSSTQLSGITTASSSPDTNKVYPVQATSDGKLGVYVPWTDDQKLPVTQLAVASTKDSNSHTAVSSGPVYINTYDVEKGTTNRTHTGAISIEGKNGISVTADNSGKIEISGHEKPPILSKSGNSDDGNLVPNTNNTASDTNVNDKYLRSDGKWAVPYNNKVNFVGYPKKDASNVWTSDSANANGTTSYNKVVTSIKAGTGITLERDDTGALTIIGQESGLTIENGEGLEKSDSSTTRTLNLKAATTDELGGVKVGAFGTGEISQGTITVDGNSCTIYAPPANGKYYPVEVNTDAGVGGHAVVKIPDVPSPFYDDTADENKFSIAIEDYKIISYMDQLSTVFTGETSWENTAIQAFLNQVNSQIEKDSDKINTEAIFNDCLKYGSLQVTEKKGLSITCPSNVLTAQLDCSMVAYGMTLSVPIKSTKVGSKQIISIQNSCPNAGFAPETDYTAYLRFTTKHKRNSGKITEKGHTYNATIDIIYDYLNEEYSTPEIYF